MRSILAALALAFITSASAAPITCKDGEPCVCVRSNPETLPWNTSNGNVSITCVNGKTASRTFFNVPEKHWSYQSGQPIETRE